MIFMPLNFQHYKLLNNLETKHKKKFKFDQEFLIKSKDIMNLGSLKIANRN